MRKLIVINNLEFKNVSYLLSICYTIEFPHAENIFILFRQGMKRAVIYFDIRVT